MRKFSELTSLAVGLPTLGTCGLLWLSSSLLTATEHGQHSSRSTRPRPTVFASPTLGMVPTWRPQYERAAVGCGHCPARCARNPLTCLPHLSLSIPSTKSTLQVGFVRDERLAFNMPGFSPLEPAFASIVPAKGDECHGAVSDC